MSIKIYLLAFSFCVVTEYGTLTTKTVRFKKFEGRCKECRNPLIYLSDIHLSTFDRITYVSLKVHVTDTLKEGEGTKMHINLRRCSSGEDLNSCETFNTIKINKFCNFLEGDNKPWSPFRKLIEPPIGGCPFKKGISEVKNGTFDGAKFSNLPVSDWYWRIKVHLLSDVTDKILMCVNVEGLIAPI